MGTHLLVCSLLSYCLSREYEYRKVEWLRQREAFSKAVCCPTRFRPLVTGGNPTPKKYQGGCRSRCRGHSGIAKPGCNSILSYERAWNAFEIQEYRGGQPDCRRFHCSDIRGIHIVRRSSMLSMWDRLWKSLRLTTVGTACWSWCAHG
jgi:hypothetical protein